MAPSIPITQGSQKLLIKSPLRKANEATNELLEVRAAIKLKAIQEDDEKGEGEVVVSNIPASDFVYSQPNTPLTDSIDCFDSFVDFSKLQSREFTVWTDSEHNIQKCGLFANLTSSMTLKELLLSDRAVACHQNN